MTAEHQVTTGWIDAYLGLQQVAAHCAAEDADDLQDAVIAALRQGQPVENKRSWLRRVVGNRRRQRVRRTMTWQRVQRTLPDIEDAPGPDSTASTRQLIRRLRRALQTLDPPLREALVLRFFAGLTTKEIAARQGCPHGTARWRVHAALKQLRANLDEDGGRAAWLASVAPFLSVPPPPFTPSTPTKIGTAMLTVSALGLTAALTASALSPTADDSDSVAPASPAAVTTPSSPPVHRSWTPRPLARLGAVADAKQTTPAGVVVVGTTRGAAEDAPDVQDCNDALATYNRSAGDPDAADLLIEAAGCYEALGLYTKAIKALTVLLMRDPESPHVEDAKKQLNAVYAIMLEAKPGNASPPGVECLAPLEGAKGPELVVERLAAADCLEAASLIGSAFEQRTLVAPSLEGAELEAHPAALERLSQKVEALERMRWRALSLTKTPKAPAE
ncbi:MAG: sigma-70 family RNA polymerase sigma factor [Myxococcota bacterium]